MAEGRQYSCRALLPARGLGGSASVAFSFLYLAFRALLGAARSGVRIGRFLPIDEDEALRDSDRDGGKDNGFGRRGVFAVNDHAAPRYRRHRAPARRRNCQGRCCWAPPIEAHSADDPSGLGRRTLASVDE